MGKARRIAGWTLLVLYGAWVIYYLLGILEGNHMAFVFAGFPWFMFSTAIGTAILFPFTLFLGMAPERFMTLSTWIGLCISVAFNIYIIFRIGGFLPFRKRQPCPAQSNTDAGA